MYIAFVNVQLVEDKFCFYCSGTMILLKRLEEGKSEKTKDCFNRTL
jgi:hypothetical protein